MDTTNICKINDYPAIEPRPERIPAWMRPLPWAVWIAEPRPGQPEKFNKAPRNPVTGIKIGANNPDNFDTFEQAMEALKSGKYSGIGMLVVDGIAGIDIDNYRDEFKRNPDAESWAKRAIKQGAYCELSPSGEGLRLFVRGKLPGKGRKVGSLEIYDRARFLTVTGKLAKGSSAQLSG